MDTIVTVGYEHLLAARDDLVRHCEREIPSLRSRAKFQPDFQSISILSRGSHAILCVNVCEHLLRNTPWEFDRQLSLRYAVLPCGTVSLADPEVFEYLGAERAYKEPLESFIRSLMPSLEVAASKVRANARARVLKESIVAAVWAPKRLAALLERGGWDLIEAL